MEKDDVKIDAEVLKFSRAVFEAFNFDQEDIDRWNAVPPGDDDEDF